MTSQDGLPPIRDVIRAAGISARRTLGQNFLLDLNLTRRIALAAGNLAGHTIVEIGPGPGGLTRALLSEGADKVVAIERDQRFEPALRRIGEAYPGRLDIRMADALEFDYAALNQRGAWIMANLPYNIATPLLVGWLTTGTWPPWYGRMVLMFQREVADRIVAPPGGKTYGRLSVLAQWRTSARIVRTIPARAFTPSPKVDSALVEFVPRPEAHTCRPSDLERLTAAAFGQRRKMLRASLRGLTPEPERLLGLCDIDPTWRAEQLTVEQFLALAEALARCGEPGG